MDEMLSMGIFLRDPSSYLRKFRRKPRKTPKDKVDNRDRDGTRHLSSTRLERRPAQPLVGCVHKRILKELKILGGHHFETRP